MNLSKDLPCNGSSLRLCCHVDCCAKHVMANERIQVETDANLRIVGSMFLSPLGDLSSKDYSASWRGVYPERHAELRPPPEGIAAEEGLDTNRDGREAW